MPRATVNCKLLDDNQDDPDFLSYEDEFQESQVALRQGERFSD